MDANPIARDLTAEAEAGLIELPIGRDLELQAIFRVLAQEEKPNVLIKGPAGCGKTALAEGVAYLMANHTDERSPKKRRLLALDLTALNAGAMYVGQLEERIAKFVAEVREDPSTVVFIDEIHMLMGFGRAGDSGASRDLSQILKPALARGEFRCIGATTQEEFERYVSPDAAFTRRFTALDLAPMAPQAVVQILRRMAVKARYTHQVEITEPTLRAVVTVSEGKWPQRFQPDKGIDLFRMLLQTLEEGRRDPGRAPTVHTLDSYICLLEAEVKLLHRQDFQSLRNRAEGWLGVQSATCRNVDLDAVRLVAQLQTLE